MCNDKITPKEEQVKCGRCGKIANPNNHWTNGWPLYGYIKVGFPSILFEILCGNKTTLEQRQAWWNKGHPAMTKNEAQEAIFQWSYDNDKYRLCYDCQELLIQTIGKFFKIPQQASKLCLDKKQGGK
ncbi:MAG: hypothetical protein PHX21_13105 [bacterium]|nr:hypothetical protein [bacterium]